jgi:hypothetical protein
MEPAVQEMKTLLEYLVKHNEDHADEIMDLAEQAEAAGNTQAHQYIARGVDLLNESNESLRAALAVLEA